MTLVVVHTSPIGPEKKRQIEEAIVHALEREGFPESQAVLLFQEEAPDSPDALPFRTPRAVPASPGDISPFFKTRARRTQAELAALKSRLTELLRTKGTLTSLQARQTLDLMDCTWAPPTLRRIFGELESEGLVVQRGLKRNTCYAWRGPEKLEA